MKQKTIFYTLLILMCGFLTVSCSDDDDDGIKFYYSNSEGKEVRVNAINVYLDMGAVVRVEDVSGDYEVKSSSPDIVDNVVYYDDRFSIKANKVGTTTLTLTDSRGETASLAITVVKRETRLTVIESFVDILATNPTPEDQEKIAALKGQIGDQLLAIGDSYKLTYNDSESGAVDVYKENSTTPLRSGTFVLQKNYEENRMVFVMTFKDKVTTYYFSTSYNMTPSQRSSESRPVYFIQDFFNLYENYPGVNFTRANGVERLKVSAVN